MTSSSFRSGNCSDDYQEESGVLDSCIEDQLADALDDLTAKSAKTRLVAYEKVRKTLSERYIIEFVFNRKVTILDTLNRCIGKRSNGQDVGSAAILISIVCSTIGPNPETDTLFNELITQMLAHLADQTAQPDTRTKCARSIGLCAFIIGVEGYVEGIMDRFYSIFSASCAKGDNTMPNPSEKIAALHNACLQSWTLLLTAVHNSSPQGALELIEEHMDKVTELLDSPHLDLKCSSGETLAIMLEMIRSQNEDSIADDIEELCDKMREIMLDSQKSRGKRDLRHQRSSFREILAAIEEGETPNLIIKFGSERLVLESWARRRQYDAFCELLGTGFNHHLAENEYLRDIFGLGPVLSPLDMPRVKRSENVSTTNVYSLTYITQPFTNLDFRAVLRKHARGQDTNQEHEATKG